MLGWESFPSRFWVLRAEAEESWLLMYLVTRERQWLLHASESWYMIT